MKQVKYSILIPTFNKCEYLNYTLKSILQNDYEDFEVIVSNDHSTDGTNELLLKIKDPRVKIIKPPFKLTQAKNYEYLLNFANGEWITILGDDDGILPHFFQTSDKLIKSHPNFEIFKFKRAIYYWEDVSDLYGDRVIFFEDLKRREKVKNSRLNLIFSLYNLKTAQDLPMIYTSGIVKKSLVQKIKKKSKNFFFHSVVPDYYSMIALVMESKQYIFSETPIFWVGVSKKSTGRKRNIYFDKNRKQHIGEIDINQNLDLSGKVSKILHKLGFQSIYLFEAIIKHPYKDKFWSGKFIRSLVYSGAIYNYILLLRKPERIKLKLKKGLFIKVIYKEIKKYKLNRFFIFSLFGFLYVFTPFFKILNKILIFIEKKTKFLFFYEKPKILVSKNRHNFSDFIKVNNFLKK